MKTSLAVLLFTLTIALASAQRNPKNELGLLLGATVTPHLNAAASAREQLTIGTGTTFQLNYARQLMTGRSLGLYAEVPALAIPLQTVTITSGVAPKNYDSFFIAPGMRAKFFPSAWASPWLSVGGGYALFEESAQRMDGTHNTTRGTSGGAAQFGGGVDVRTPIKFVFPIGFRVELRDLYTSKPNFNLDTGGGFQHNLIFSGGLVLRF
jgi:hypothetical protein